MRKLFRRPYRAGQPYQKLPQSSSLPPATHKRAEWSLKKMFGKGTLIGLVVVVVIGWWVFRPVLWDPTQRITIALATPSLFALSYDPATERAVVWQLPDTLQVEVVGGYGKYVAKSLAGLDRQEKQDGRLMRDSTAYFLGVGVDGAVMSERIHQLPPRVNKAWIEARLREGLWAKILGKKVTTLSWGDLFRLWHVVVYTRPDEIEYIDLGESNVLRQVFLPDGSMVYQADPARVTSLVQRYMMDEGLANEGLNVLIRNTTSAYGLGDTFGRLLTTVGIRVVGVEDDDEELQHTFIGVETGDRRTTRTVRYLERLLGTKAEVSPMAGMRAEVVVRLGKDYQEKIRGK